MTPRKVLRSSGKYEVDWGTPQYLGVSCRIIRNFLAKPKQRLSLAGLASRYSNAEISAFMLVACEYTDIILRDLHSSISEMDIVKEIYYDPTYRTVGGQYPAISKNYWLNADHFVLSATESIVLREFIFAQFPSRPSDPYLSEAVNQWMTCLQRINTAIAAIASSQGKSTAKMNEAIDKVIRWTISGLGSFASPRLGHPQASPFKHRFVPDDPRWPSGRRPVRRPTASEREIV